MSSSSIALSYRVELANAYLSALEAHRQSTVPASTVIERLLRSGGSARRRLGLAEVERELESLPRRMRQEGVGSAAEWGVLSVAWDSQRPAATILLEDTLNSLPEHDRVDELIKLLPLARASVEVGSNSGLLGHVEREVLELACDDDLPAPVRRKLTDHLPAHLRPIAPDLAWFNRDVYGFANISIRRASEDDLYNYGLSTLEAYVTDDLGGEAEKVLVLSDIVVAGPARQRGLATAILREFLAYADDVGITVVAEFIPAHVFQGDALTALARWYQKYGFQVSAKPDPASWDLQDRMIRTPNTGVH